jgi:hypothetical protein
MLSESISDPVSDGSSKVVELIATPHKGFSVNYSVQASIKTNRYVHYFTILSVNKHAIYHISKIGSQSAHVSANGEAELADELSESAIGHDKKFRLPLNLICCVS